MKMLKIRKLRGIFAILTFLPFICLAQQWPDPPVNISTPGQNASAQQVAVDLNGNVVAVWLENDMVKSNSATSSGGWGSAIATLSGTGASAPQVVIDSNGNATAVWVQNGIIQAASLPLNGIWPSSPDEISVSGASSPQIAIDTNGNVVAVWEESGVIQSATKLMGGTWPVSPDTISAAGASFPQVAIGSNGAIVAVWQGVVSSISTIYAASKLVSGSWGEPLVISSATINSVYPKIAVDESGHATAVWFRFDLSETTYSNVVVQSSSQPPGGSWSIPVDISSAGIKNPAELALAVVANPSEMAIAEWTTSYNGSLFNCEWNLFSNGTWMPKADVLQPGNLLAYDLDLSVDSMGNAYTAWMNYDDPSSSLIVQGGINDISGFSPGYFGQWTLSTGGANAYPCGQVCINGTTVYLSAAWVNFDGTHDNIQAITSNFSVLAPPSNLSVTANVNDFGVVSEIYNVLSWQASPSSRTNIYFIFRNGLYLATVDSNTFQYIDHNRTVGETVVYGVAGYDDKGCQSTTALFPFTN